MVKEILMAQIVTYGIGGYDPTKPNDNIVEIIDIPDEGEAIEEAQGFGS